MSPTSYQAAPPRTFIIRGLWFFCEFSPKVRCKAGSQSETAAATQPVEHASTQQDVRTEVLANNRVNAIVFGGFAGLALAISIVGVAGVPIDGLTIAAIGVVAGGLVGWGLSRLAGNYVAELKLPEPLPLIASAAVIFAAAALASLVPAESTLFKRFALIETNSN